MKKIIITIIAVLIVILVIVGINRKDNVKTGNTTPIRIGASISLTGFASPWGEYGRNGMELAVKNINNAGGINGRKIELVIEDDHTDAKTAVSAYNKLISIDHVDGIIGGVFDFTALPLIPLAQTNNIAFITPSNFRIAGGFELNDQSFVMMTDFEKTINQLKTYISKENIKSLAVVHFQSAWGNEIARSLNIVMKEYGTNGIVDEAYAKIGDNDFRTMITKLKSKKVEAVFLDMVGNDPVNFITQAKELGFNPKYISYNGVADSFLKENKSLLEGVVIINWEVSSPEFIRLYKDAYGIDPTKSANKYFDAVYVLATAIVNSNDKSQVASYINNTTFTTPNGVIKFTKDHSVETIPVEIQVVKDEVQVKY